MTADRDLENLVRIVADGIRILRTRDGVAVTDAQCTERARNIVSAVLVTFELRALPPVPERVPDWRTTLIEGRPIGHSWSCKCIPCSDYKQITGRKS